MSIMDNARRMASEGVAAFVSHQSKRGSDKLPGRKVILSGVWLVIEFISRLRSLSEKVVDVFDDSEVAVVQAVNVSVVIRCRKAFRPLRKVREGVLNLYYFSGVNVY